MLELLPGASFEITQDLCALLISPHKADSLPTILTAVLVKITKFASESPGHRRRLQRLQLMDTCYHFGHNVRQICKAKI